jgi:hypothetical protein
MPMAICWFMIRFEGRGGKHTEPCSTLTIAEFGSEPYTIFGGLPMSHAHKFPKSTLQYLASCIGDKLSAKSAEALAHKVKIELAETFQIWFLERTAILRPNARLSELAQRTDYWHHQVRHNRKAKEYALSRTFGPGVRDWEIRAVMSSVLAGEIDKAIHWIDKQEVKGDPLACLLSIPAYHMTAFWLRGNKEDKIVIVDQPASFKHLKKKRLYGEHEFLTLLAQERHAQGIPDPIPQIVAPDGIAQPQAPATNGVSE